MSVRPFRGLPQFIDDMLGGRAIRVTHAEVDDILALGTRLGLQFGDDVEDIGGQAVYTLEIGFHGQNSRFKKNAYLTNLRKYCQIRGF